VQSEMVASDEAQIASHDHRQHEGQQEPEPDCLTRAGLRSAALSRHR
jgi:hypothetical protein